MPPKSQITSLLGLANRTSSDQIRNTQLLFEFGDVPSFYGNWDESRRPLEPNQVEDLFPTAPTVTRAGAQIPSSVRVEPSLPETAREKGPSLQIKQLWEGTVTEVHGETFVAVLNDKSRLNSPEEQVEFESVELRGDDWPLVVPGSVFYWMIGTERTPSGQVRNISNIEFSRLPVWTRSSLKAASEKGSRTNQWFHANGNHPS
jgi:hypothetical protein